MFTLGPKRLGYLDPQGPQEPIIQKKVGRTRQAYNHVLTSFEIWGLGSRAEGES